MRKYEGMCIGGPKAGMYQASSTQGFVCVKLDDLLPVAIIHETDTTAEPKRSWYQWVELHRGHGVFAHESIYQGSDPMGALTEHLIEHYKPEVSEHG